MMESAESFAAALKGKSYHELRRVKNGLVAEVRGFEHERLVRADEGFCLPGEDLVCPGPDVVYQMNLAYLAKLCEKLAEQFNREFEQ